MRYKIFFFCDSEQGILEWAKPSTSVTFFLDGHLPYVDLRDKNINVTKTKWLPLDWLHMIKCLFQHN